MSANDSQHQRHLLLKAQSEILEQILPAIQQAADNLTAFMSDADDDEEIASHLREAATETLIDELVKLLTRDPQAVSTLYAIRSADGLPIDSLIASYNEVNPERARRWYAQQMQVTPEEHARLTASVPEHLAL